MSHKSHYFPSGSLVYAWPIWDSDVTGRRLAHVGTLACPADAQPVAF